MGFSCGNEKRGWRNELIDWHVLRKIAVPPDNSSEGANELIERKCRLCGDRVIISLHQIIIMFSSSWSVPFNEVLSLMVSLSLMIFNFSLSFIALLCSYEFYHRNLS